MKFQEIKFQNFAIKNPKKKMINENLLGIKNYTNCGARPKYNGLFQIQAHPRSVLSEEKPRMKRYPIPITPRKPVRGVTPPRTSQSPDEELSPSISVHPPNI